MSGKGEEIKGMEEMSTDMRGEETKDNVILGKEGKGKGGRGQRGPEGWGQAQDGEQKRVHTWAHFPFSSSQRESRLLKRSGCLEKIME